MEIYIYINFIYIYICPKWLCQVVEMQLCGQIVIHSIYRSRLSIYINNINNNIAFDLFNCSFIFLKWSLSVLFVHLFNICLYSFISLSDVISIFVKKMFQVQTRAVYAICLWALQRSPLDRMAQIYSDYLVQASKRTPFKTRWRNWKMKWDKRWIKAGNGVDLKCL